MKRTLTNSSGKHRHKPWIRLFIMIWLLSLMSMPAALA